MGGIFVFLVILFSASSLIPQILPHSLPLCRQPSGWRSYSGFACMISCQCSTGAWSLPTTCYQQMLSWRGSWWKASCWRSWLWWESRNQMRREQLWSRQPGNVLSSAWITASSSRCHRAWSTGMLGLVLNWEELSRELGPPKVSAQQRITAVPMMSHYKGKTGVSPNLWLFLTNQVFLPP